MMRSAKNRAVRINARQTAHRKAGARRQTARSHAMAIRSLVEEAFAKYDEEGCGKLSRSQMEQLLEDLNEKGAPISVESMDFVFQMADMDVNDGIDREELLDAVQAWKTYEENKQWIESVFEEYDVDKSGFIEYNELSTIMRAMNEGYPVCDEELVHVLSCCGLCLPVTRAATEGRAGELPPKVTHPIAVDTSDRPGGDQVEAFEPPPPSPARPSARAAADGTVVTDIEDDMSRLRAAADGGGQDDQGVANKEGGSSHSTATATAATVALPAAGAAAVPITVQLTKTQLLWVISMWFPNVSEAHRNSVLHGGQGSVLVKGEATSGLPSLRRASWMWDGGDKQEETSSASGTKKGGKKDEAKKKSKTCVLL